MEGLEVGGRYPSLSHNRTLYSLSLINPESHFFLSETFTAINSLITLFTIGNVTVSELNSPLRFTVCCFAVELAVSKYERNELTGGWTIETNLLTLG